MDNDVRDRLLDALHRRAKALARVTAPEHNGRQVDVVLSLHVEHVLTTSTALLGETLLRQVLGVLMNRVSEHHGVCAFCREHQFNAKRGMCDTCWNVIEREDRELDQQELMERPVKGRVT